MYLKKISAVVNTFECKIRVWWEKKGQCPPVTPPSHANPGKGQNSSIPLSTGIQELN